MFQLTASYLTPTDAGSSSTILKQPCRKTHPVVVEQMLLWFRRVRLLACIKQRKQRRRLLKLLHLGTVHCGAPFSLVDRHAFHVQRICPRCRSLEFESQPGALCCMSLPPSLTLFPVISWAVLWIKPYKGPKKKTVNRINIIIIIIKTLRVGFEPCSSRS